MASEKPTSRRDFLRGRAAARAALDAVRSLADRAAAALPTGDPASPSRPALPGGASAARLALTRRAMACEFSIEFPAAAGAAVSEAALKALDLLEEIEAQLTVYRASSEVVELNRRAASEDVETEPRLFALLELCAWLHAETRGAFDVTSAPLSRAWGFHQRAGREPAADELAAAQACVGFERIELHPVDRSVRFLTPGVEINFNAVGKGYALDRIAHALGDRGVTDFLTHGGRSSVLARGGDGGNGRAGWRVGVPHPFDPARHVGQITLRNEALGTSGSATQFFEARGRRFGHLIDPRTGWPAEGVFTATAIAATAAEADALSTAFYILGPGGAAEYCAAHADVAAVLVCPREGVADDFDVHAFNLNERRWSPGE